MQNRGVSSLLEYLRREVPLPGPDLISDGDLVARFVETRDEAAFELLVRRHGPMVFGIARRTLRNEHAAEDVLQATFLALARQASSLRRNQSLAAWLYRVAIRISDRARVKTTIATPTRLVENEPSEILEQRELKCVLDQAIDRLPDKLRRTVVLCYVSAHTTEQAARLLDCPKGTVLSRLAAARAMLQADLSRKGITVSATTLATVLTSELCSATLPSALVAIAMKAVGPATILTPIVISLAQGAVAMSWIKVTIAGAVLLTASVGLAVGIASPDPQAPNENKPTVISPVVQAPQANPAVANGPTTIPQLQAVQNAVATVMANEATTELKKTMREMADCAQREMSLRIQEFSVGRGSLETSLDSARRAKDSGLELAGNADQELAIRRSYHELMQFMAELNRARFKAGTIKEQDMQRTNYAELEAYFQLLRHGGKRLTTPAK